MQFNNLHPQEICSLCCKLRTSLKTLKNGLPNPRQKPKQHKTTVWNAKKITFAQSSSGFFNWHLGNQICLSESFDWHWAYSGRVAVPAAHLEDMDKIKQYQAKKRIQRIVKTINVYLNLATVMKGYCIDTIGGCTGAFVEQFIYPGC